jgi:hypothetical protein
VWVKDSKNKEGLKQNGKLFPPLGKLRLGRAVKDFGRRRTPGFLGGKSIPGFLFGNTSVPTNNRIMLVAYG